MSSPLVLEEVISTHDWKLLQSFHAGNDGLFHDRARPVLQRYMAAINKVTGQENDLDYMVHLVEFILNRSNKHRK